MSTTKTESEPLPSGWSHARTKDGAPYFTKHIHGLEIGTWYDPRDERSSFSTSDEKYMPPGWTASKDAKGRYTFKHLDAASSSYFNPAIFKPDAPEIDSEPMWDFTPPLPDGWTGFRDNDGRIAFFYFDGLDSTFVDPRWTGRESIEPVSKEKLTDFNPPLPEGWWARLDRKGRVYFGDDKMKTTTWRDPRGIETTTGTDGRCSVGDGLRSGRRGRVTGFDPPLPGSWWADWDNKGRVYFCNDERKLTSWRDPRLDIAKVETQDEKAGVDEGREAGMPRGRVEEKSRL